MKKLLLGLLVFALFTVPTFANEFKIWEGGIVEVVGINEKVDASDYSGSVGVTLPSYTKSGEITQIALVASETGTGSAILATQGTIFIFDADPAIASGDTALAAAGAEHKTVLSTISVVTASWITAAAGSVAVIDCNVFFRKVPTLYFAFQPIGGETSINSDAADDELLHLNFWYIEY